MKDFENTQGQVLPFETNTMNYNLKKNIAAIAEKLGLQHWGLSDTQPIIKDGKETGETQKVACRLGALDAWQKIRVSYKRLTVEEAGTYKNWLDMLDKNCYTTGEALELMEKYPVDSYGKPRGVLVNFSTVPSTVMALDLDAIKDTSTGEKGRAIELPESFLELFQDAYIERSMSGKGYHVLFTIPEELRGKLKGDMVKHLEFGKKASNLPDDLKAAGVGGIDVFYGGINAVLNITGNCSTDWTNTQKSLRLSAAGVEWLERLLEKNGFFVGKGKNGECTTGDGSIDVVAGDLAAIEKKAIAQLEEGLTEAADVVRAMKQNAALTVRNARGDVEYVVQGFWTAVMDGDAKRKLKVQKNKETINMVTFVEAFAEWHGEFDASALDFHLILEATYHTRLASVLDDLMDSIPYTQRVSVKDGGWYSGSNPQNWSRADIRERVYKAALKERIKKGETALKKGGKKKGASHAFADVPELCEKLDVTQKGKLLGNLKNVRLILKHAPEFKGKYGVNSMTTGIVFVEPPEYLKKQKGLLYGRLPDVDVNTVESLRTGLALRGVEATEKDIKAAIIDIGGSVVVNALADRWKELRDNWDGKPRLYTAAKKLALSDSYDEATKELICEGVAMHFIATAKRGMFATCKIIEAVHKGDVEGDLRTIKHDTMLLLVGEGGCHKSSFVQLVGETLGSEFYVEDLGCEPTDKPEVARAVRGRAIVGLEECNKIFRMDVNRFKQLTTAKSLNARDLYVNLPRNFAVTHTFWGCLNPEGHEETYNVELFVSEPVSRRVIVVEIGGIIDLEAWKQDGYIEQVLGEAAYYAEQDMLSEDKGEPLHLTYFTGEKEEAIKKLNRRYMVRGGLLVTVRREIERNPKEYLGGFYLGDLHRNLRDELERVAGANRASESAQKGNLVACLKELGFVCCSREIKYNKKTYMKDMFYKADVLAEALQGEAQRKIGELREPSEAEVQAKAELAKYTELLKTPAPERTGEQEKERLRFEEREPDAAERLLRESYEAFMRLVLSPFGLRGDATDANTKEMASLWLNRDKWQHECDPDEVGDEPDLSDEELQAIFEKAAGKEALAAYYEHTGQRVFDAKWLM